MALTFALVARFGPGLFFTGSENGIDDDTGSWDTSRHKEHSTPFASAGLEENTGNTIIYVLNDRLVQNLLVKIIDP